MIGFAPADFLLTVVAPELRESIAEPWDTVVFELAEKAKDKGLRGIEEFLQSSEEVRKDTFLILQKLTNRRWINY